MNFKKSNLPEKFAERLGSAVDSGTLSHAVLICGGTKKERSEAALLLSQALLCEGSGEKPCLKCNTCKRIKAGIHPDVQTVRGTTEKQKNISMDDVRSLIARAYVKPNEAPFQIFLMDVENQASNVVQNAILKLIEEPPAVSRFILTAPSKDVFLTTILSRVTSFAISQDSGQAAGEKENPKAKAGAEALIQAICKKSEYDLILASGKLEKDRKSIKAALEKLTLVLRDAAVMKYTSSEGKEKEEAAALSEKLTLAQIVKIEEFLSELILDCDKNANENLLLSRLSIGLKQHIS